MADVPYKQYFTRSLIIALIFQIAWVVTGLLFTLFGANVNWSLLIVNLLTLWAPMAFIFVTKANLSEAFQVGFGIFITASTLVGSVLGGYAAIPNWDTIVHIYSGTILSWFGYSIASMAETYKNVSFPIWFKNTIALMTPMAFAAAWEIYEYMSDKYFGTVMQAGGLEDTIIDMLAALVGAMIALFVATLWLSRKRV